MVQVAADEEAEAEAAAEYGGAGASVTVNRPFLYGTHYSTPGYVAHFLVRRAPDLSLHLQVREHIL